MNRWIGRPTPPSQLQVLIRDHPSIRTYRGFLGPRQGKGLAASFEQYLRARLEVRPGGWEGIRDFLRRCLYVKDRESHGRDEVWMHPEDFEKSRAGDCEDHALWAWVQYVRLGIEARFTAGIQGKRGHAWVTLYRGGAVTVCESTAKKHARFLVDGAEFRTYEPVWSVNGALRFFTHS